MPKVLQKIRLDSCDTVDSAANQHAKILLVKRDSGEPAPPTREQQLQAAADQYVAKLQKSASPLAQRTERAGYLDRLFAKREHPTNDAPPAPVNKSFSKLQSMAKRAAAKDPSLSVDQHFAKLAEDNPKLMAKAVRVTLDWDDDDDQDETDETGADSLDADADDVDPPMLDPFPANADGVGRPQPTAAEARTNSGRATSYTPAATFNADGDNLLQTPRQAVIGGVEGSYDPRRLGSKPRPNGPGVTSQEGMNPAVDTRKRLEKIEQRVQKYLAANPTASRVEAHRYAEMGKKQRRAYNGALAR
jgi:hypothetical protein